MSPSRTEAGKGSKISLGDLACFLLSLKSGHLKA